MKNRLLLILGIAVCCMLCFSCEPKSYERLNTEVLLINGDMAFSFSRDDFIKEYNRWYHADNGAEYIHSQQGWEKFDYNDSPFCSGEYHYYRYNADPAVLTHPTITAYVPVNGENVYAITIDFDDHGYSKELYEVYEAQCYYALKALFPECSDENIENIYTMLNRQANENMSLERLSKNTIPMTVWHTDSIGVFSYFAQGDYMHLCIIPVTQAYLNEIRQNGAQLYDIDIVPQ